MAMNLYNRGSVENGDAMRPAAMILFSALSLLPAATVAAELPSWDYMGGGNDDEDWGMLSPAYAKCTVGTQQSPVAINEAKVSMMTPLSFDYHTSDIVEQRRELTLLLQFNDGNSIRHEGISYKLRQIRFHTPSEHSIEGGMPPLEMQFIHQNGDNILILAVQAVVGAENTAIKALVENLPHKGAPEARLSFDPNNLLPEKRGFYAYTGSLSWPPCTEGVEWRVMKNPITLSKEQLKAVTQLLGRNARMPQPIYFRTITQTRE